MIKVSVLYPSKPGSRFDVDYYLTVHMPMSARLLGAAVKDISIEIGIGGGAPNEPSPYAAIVGFTCDSVDAFMAITYDFFRTFDLSCRRAGWYKQGEQDL
jgi:uncharacterized protein (TIGR02118 family)